jgi:hypothetical protein
MLVLKNRLLLARLETGSNAYSQARCWVPTHRVAQAALFAAQLTR